MLPTKFEKYAYDLFFLGVILFLCLGPAYGADSSKLPSVNVPSAQGMVANIATQVPAVMKLVTALAYVMGFYFIFYGLLKLKQYGESRTMMSSDHSLMGPMVLITIGAMLLYLPTTVQMGLTTFWSDPNPYAYVTQSDEFGQFYKTVFLIIQLLGTIAFIRGLVILSGLQGHAQPGTFGRGMTHIIGGVFCINLYQFVQVVMSTLGIQA